jgi:4'-phosphopantetheinyl transferase
MPLENLHNGTNSAWALWKIDEDETYLAAEVAAFETIPAYITNPIKRKEFFAGRVLIKKLLDARGLNFAGLSKDEYGKPSLKVHRYHVSLSYSYPYVAAVIDAVKPVGIDLEQPKDKLLRIAARVLSPAELKDAGEDISKHCVYWCAKESLVKIHGKKDLIFARNLRVEPFFMARSGELIGSIIVNTSQTTIPLQYFDYGTFVVVLNQ